MKGSGGGKRGRAGSSGGLTKKEKLTVIQSEIEDQRSELNRDMLEQGSIVIQNSINRLTTLVETPATDGSFLRLLMDSDLEKLTAIKNECNMTGGYTETHLAKMATILFAESGELQKLVEQLQNLDAMFKSFLMKFYIYDYFEGGQFSNVEFKKHLTTLVLSKSMS